MPRTYPDRTVLKQFLDSALVDPNKRGNMIESQMVEIATPEYCEIRVIERMQEAARLRKRINESGYGPKRETLVEQYTLVLKSACTALSIAAGKMNDVTKPSEAKNRTRSKASGSDVPVPPSEGLVGQGNSR